MRCFATQPRIGVVIRTDSTVPVNPTPTPVAAASPPVIPRALRRLLRWLNWPVIVFGVLAPVGIVLSVRADHMLGALLAYVNCLIAGIAGIRFFRGQWIPGAVPLLFLPLTTMAWAFAPLFFAIFVPDFSYHTNRTLHEEALNGFAHYEATFTVFLLVYLAVITPFVRWSRRAFRGSRFASHPRALAYSTALIVLGILFFNAAARVAGLPDALTYWAIGLFNYYKMLLIPVGAFILRVDRLTRIVLLAALVGFAAFYTLANDRSSAVFPIVGLLIGVLFFSDLRPNAKAWLIFLIMLALPLYMTIGDITRRLGGMDPGFENLGRRAQLLSRTGEYLEQVNPFVKTMGRIFVTGGHSIVTRTPRDVPYLEFSIGRYSAEMLRSLLPRRFTGTIYTYDIYATNWHLRRYGFEITDKTAVGLSMMGHFWMLGGLMAVIIGALAVGLLHGALVVFIKRCWEHSIAKAMIFIAVLAPELMWARGEDFITHWRMTVWRLLFGLAIYVLYRMIGGRLRRAAGPEDTYAGIPKPWRKRMRRVAGPHASSVPSPGPAAPRPAGTTG